MTELAPRTQFKLIQALRGIAALWVVLFHFYMGQHVTGITAQLPTWLNYAIFGYGSAGVAIFFVLSGFVITHSLAGKTFGAREFARFAVRRSIRLDPPYWAAITLSILVSVAIAHSRHLLISLPSAPTVFAHVFYLQELIGSPKINVVFWTLTYEIQFYLVLGLAACFRSKLLAKSSTAEFGRAIVMVPMGMLALLAAANMLDRAPHGLFITMWHGFFLGVLAYETGYLRMSPVPLLILVGVTLFGAAAKTAVFGTPAAAAALGLFVAGRSGYLLRGLAGRAFQFLGTISYSLYLIHVPVAYIGFSAWVRLAGRGMGADCLGFILILAVTIFAATAFWWLFELPSHKIAATLFRQKRAYLGTQPQPENA